MFAHLNETALLVSALLALAIGSIWYSPLCFGVAWKRLRGSVVQQIQSPRILPLVFMCGGMAVIASGAIQILLTESVADARAVGTSLIALLACVGAPWYALTVSEGRSSAYALLHFGYLALCVVVSIVVNTYWPW